MKFIEKAKLVHGERYDYSEVVYCNNYTKIKIICPIHGVFLKTPSNHLIGQGCVFCSRQSVGGSKALSVNGFVFRAREVHGGKYNYEQVEYKNNRTPVLIVCPQHGSFSQSPSNHLKYGCKECGKLVAASKQAKTTGRFIEEALSVHSGKYSYEPTVYHKSHDKVLIDCPIHGIFRQSPNAHLRGQGCPSCKAGVNHPRYGKSTHSSGYYGKYKGRIFRSLPELFWMLSSDRCGQEFISIDQDDLRRIWQVVVKYGGRWHTYCADFYLVGTNEVIDIKPVWRQQAQEEKLKQGEEAYRNRGYNFRLVDTREIKVDLVQFVSLVDKGDIELIGNSKEKFKRRFKRRF